MSKLYDVVGHGDNKVYVLKGISPPGSVLILSSEENKSYLAIRCNNINPSLILPQFASYDTEILDTRLRPNFGWSFRERGFWKKAVNLSNYRGWYYMSSSYTVAELFTTIKEVYDRNTRRTSGSV